MKLKYDVVINDVADSKIAVVVGAPADQFNGFIKMDANTAFVLELLKNEITEDEIVAQLVDKFSAVDDNELRVNLRNLLDDFKNHSLI